MKRFVLAGVAVLAATASAFFLVGQSADAG